MTMMMTTIGYAGKYLWKVHDDDDNDDDDDDWLCGEVFMEDIGDTWDWGHTGPFLFP